MSEEKVKEEAQVEEKTETNDTNPKNEEVMNQDSFIQDEKKKKKSKAPIIFLIHLNLLQLNIQCFYFPSINHLTNPYI